MGGFRIAAMTAGALRRKSEVRKYCGRHLLRVRGK
jgi:hypothetical protein